MTANPVEASVRRFYDTDGWVQGDEGIGEDRYFRLTAEERGTSAGQFDAMPAMLLGQGDTLLIVGGGDLPHSHELAAARFPSVTCLDVSAEALAICKAKLGDQGSYLNGSVLDYPLDQNAFDAALCAHVIYHIHADRQADAVRRILNATRPGGRVVFLTVNPRAPFMLIQRLLKLLRINRLLKMDKLYMVAQPLGWWEHFADNADLEIVAHEPMSRNQAKALVPLASLRPRVIDSLARLQRRRPRLALWFWTYVAVVLTKRP
ncbi:MAG: class I SAM-dependent methyltransferase [Pseudomonadota bacterium]